MPIQGARQIHLDFHTSEHIPDVGALFDKKQWQEALKVGHVNAINIFAKCHHSWCYYPTKFGMVHPTLKRDLLGKQIEACHEIGVRCPIYFTVGWSATEAEMHPEWVVRNRDGSMQAINYDPKAQPGDKRLYTSWKFLCPSGAYAELMYKQTRELCERYRVDGFWYDICRSSGPCYCANCLEGMRKLGLNPDVEADAISYYDDKWRAFFTECNRIIGEHHPQATVYYNGITKMVPPDFTPWMTQIELEDLPTTWGGYDRFPLRSKYYIDRGKPLVAMSGKFHTSWGEFGGFKHADAMRYEAAAMIAYGALCNFGDQMHPSGVMDMSTYEAVGEAFKYVEQIEQYGLDAEMCSNLGVWCQSYSADDQGVANMLLEAHLDFEVARPLSDLSRFKTIVLTGARCLDEAAAGRLASYVAHGGSLLVLGESALDAKGERLLLDVGAEYLGPAKYELDYTVAGDRLRRDLVASPFLNYQGALRVAPVDAEVLASIKEPYFDRTYGHYCSHRNTPNRLEDAPHPAAIKKGRIVYLPHRLGLIYQQLGARVHRQFLLNALGLVYSEPTLEVANLPSAGRVNLLLQRANKRYVAHLLYAPALQRGQCLVIEDLVPVYNVGVTLRVPEKVAKVYLAPSGEAVVWQREGNAVRLVVPKGECHQIVVFEYTK